MLLSPGSVWSQTPAPPQSLDDVPSDKKEEVTRLLRKVRERHGDDAVVIQTHLSAERHAEGLAC